MYMLQLSNSLLNKSVLSLRTGTPVATILSAIINPNNLKIEGFYCQDRFDKKELIMLYQDIREILPQGYVVNDHDDSLPQHPQMLLQIFAQISQCAPFRSGNG